MPLYYNVAYAMPASTIATIEQVECSDCSRSAKPYAWLWDTVICKKCASNYHVSDVLVNFTNN